MTALADNGARAAARRARLGEPTPLETAFAIISLTLLTDIVDAPLQVLLGADEVVAGIPVKRMVLIPTFAVSVFMLWRRCSVDVSVLIRRMWPIIALIALAATSTVWSAAPSRTATWSVGLAGTSAFGLFLGLRFPREQQLRVLAVALGAVTAASALAALPPDWQQRLGTRHGHLIGLFLDTNLCGRVVSLCALTWAVLAIASTRWRPAAIAVAIASGVALRQTQSLTSQLALAAALSLAVLLLIVRGHPPARRRLLLSAVGCVALAVAIGVAIRSQDVLRVLNKTASVGARIDIWRKVLGAVRSRPWLGAGYGAFWRGTAGPVPTTNPGMHAHNGFLDLTAELGVLGLALFVIPAVAYARAAVRQAVTSRSAWASWPPLFLAWWGVMNLAESCLVRHKIYWALYVAGVTWIAAGTRIDVAAEAAALDAIDEREAALPRIGDGGRPATVS